MGSIILLVFLGFIFPGHSIPVSPRTPVPGKSMAPIVYVYPPIPGNSLILTCLLHDFAPGNIVMQWLKNGQAIPENEYVNIPAVKEKSGDSHYAFSKLTMYTCMLDPEWLEMK